MQKITHKAQIIWYICQRIGDYRIIFQDYLSRMTITRLNIIANKVRQNPKLFKEG